MIQDAKWRFSMPVPQTIVVVAPRILLANQLCSEFLEHIDNTEVLHVHSGDTHHFKTTKPKTMEKWYHKTIKNILIFTTYHSLHRIQEAQDIEVDTIYFDESHNSVQKNFLPAVKHFSNYATRKYFFTATPKENRNPDLGMNNAKVFGKVIAQVPAPELIAKGYIIPPKVKAVKYPFGYFESQEEIDKKVILDALKNEEHMDKVLVTAKSTSSINNLINKTNFQAICHTMKYNVLHITSKFGAIINGKKVNRETFFNLMNKWGADPDKKFVMFHHSILSEGMNVSGLTAAILMRNLDLITMAQTIGRVIRLDKSDAAKLQKGELKPQGSGFKKPFGKMFVPVYNNVGISTEKRLQGVVDTIFTKGEAQVSITNVKH
tara:strand:- start:156 stop:1283 length:1128 start_codon:yes stop_codon:yes gene_type:complete